ncbi:MAG: PepSY domain-containing protein [Stellaceae bacterium]
MDRFKTLVGIVAFGLAVASATTAAFAYTGQELAKDAKITPQEARTTALKAVRGQITGGELEKEPGGSGLRYSFDVRLHGVTHEVDIDAKTGKLLENSFEEPNSD